MNYRDFYKNKKATDKDIMRLIPEGVKPSEFRKGVTVEMKMIGDEFTAARIASRNLQEDANYYSRIDESFEEDEGVCEEHGVKECATCGCGDPMDSHEEEDGYDFNDGLPKLGGALAIPHHGQPIMMGKVVQIGGGFGKGPATGELGGMTAADIEDKDADKGGFPADSPGDKEPLTAGGQKTDTTIASKSVGGPVTPGEGQKQGGINTKGCIAGKSSEMSHMNEGKQKVREVIKQVLKEIRFDKGTGKWVRIDEGGHKAGCQCGFCKNKGTFGKKAKEDKKEDKKDKEMDEGTVNMKMGPSYKVVQPTLVKTQDNDKVKDMFSRSNQYEPSITEMYDEEEECKMNERYVDLANSKHNLSESELSEMKTLREKIDMLAEKKKKWLQGAVDPDHEGFCSPMTKKTCTPRRKAFAMRAKHGGFEENTVNMKMGPSYKKVQPTLAKTAADDFARTNEYDPEVSELTNPDLEEPEAGNPDTHGHHPNRDMSRDEKEFGHPGQPGGYKTWQCDQCGYEVTKMGGTKPLPKRWPDGHVCHFELDKAKEVAEAGLGAVQHSSYRVVGKDHGNLPQSGKQRWANDVDEGAKPSKVSKTISKGMKTKKTKKNPFLKFQKAKKTSTGVHKRKL